MAKVVLSKKAMTGLKKVPDYIIDKFYRWVDAVEFEGLQQVRKVKSYHDEPLKGKLKGLRSIRLNKAYRAIYQEQSDGSLELIEVMEVNKHEYKK